LIMNWATRMKTTNKILFIIGLIIQVTVPCLGLEEESSRITDEVIPLALEDFPQRPAPLLELGNPFLNTGPISEGFEIPTGAVWQPSFMAWGTYRSAFQSFYNGTDDVTEWANRFDLFGNLYLTPTERILAGFRFLDDGGRFTGYTIDAPESVRKNGSGFDNEFNFNLQTLFFEGDFGELFPNLDKQDKYGLDFGVAIGRQPLSFQDGMLINDNIDAIGISKINLKPPTVVNYRSAFVWGGNELNRMNLGNDDSDSTMYGWFNEIDWRLSTVEFDVIYVEGSESTGNGIYAGLGATQRLGRYNTTFRILSSSPVDDETVHNSDGLLLFGEVSWTPHGNENFIYMNGFRGFQKFRSASRDPLAGGPLGQAGVLFEAVGIGRYSAPLSNVADDAFGGALGYQMFFNETRQQLIFELGGRYALEAGQRAIGPGVSYQTAFGRRGILRMDTYAVFDKERTAAPKDDEIRFGGRVELIFKF